MRQPTPLHKELESWRKMLKGDFTRRTNEIYPGYYKTRAFKRGPFIPCRIWIESVIDFETAELTEPETVAMSIGNKVYRNETEIWEKSLYARPVTLEEWNWLKAKMEMLILNGILPSQYT